MCNGLPMIQIADNPVSGAGFCRRLAEREADGGPTITRLIRSMLDDEDDAIVRTCDTTKRSAIMRSVWSKETKPELALRSALQARAAHRLHAKLLAGRPDIVLPKWRACIHLPPRLLLASPWLLNGDDAEVQLALLGREVQGQRERDRRPSRRSPAKGGAS